MGRTPSDVGLILRNLAKTGQFILPSPHSGPVAPPRDWDALRRAYEQHTGPLADLAETNGIQLRTLQDYIRKKGWLKPDTPPPSKSAKPKIAANKNTRSKTLRVRTQIEAVRHDLLARLFKALMRKLEQVENSMESETPLSPADDERQLRSLGTLAKTVEKVDELTSADLANPGAGRSSSPKPGAAPETASNDDDKLRREFAARIKRLRERLAR